MERYLITILILLPVAGALLAAMSAYAPARKDGTQARWIALGCSVVTFALSLLLLKGDGGAGGFRFVQDV
ncbi:MAG TPA: hypothetical protein VE775_03770, partial [Pyrinomonadaceae bacterium]|nr:hypothetical protein [Pyrinomonadaceae bacterium]